MPRRWTVLDHTVPYGSIWFRIWFCTGGLLWILGPPTGSHPQTNYCHLVVTLLCSSLFSTLLLAILLQLFHYCSCTNRCKLLLLVPSIQPLCKRLQLLPLGVVSAAAIALYTVSDSAGPSAARVQSSATVAFRARAGQGPDDPPRVPARATCGRGLSTASCARTRPTPGDASWTFGP